MDHTKLPFMSKNTRHYARHFLSGSSKHTPMPVKDAPKLTQSQAKALDAALANVKAVYNRSIAPSGTIVETQVAWSKVELHKSEYDLIPLIEDDEDEPIELSNGNVLCSLEATAISAYTGPLYRLVNGYLDGDQTNLNIYANSHGISKEAMLLELRDAPSMAKVIASAINKLPKTTVPLYRGDSVPLTTLEEWRAGKTIVSQKFLSCSTDLPSAEQYAIDNTEEYEKDTSIEHRPVLFVFDGKNAKDISSLSLYEEEEHIYPPGQGFRAVKVDEKTYPSLAVIYLQEVNRINNTWKG